MLGVSEDVATLCVYMGGARGGACARGWAWTRRPPGQLAAAGCFILSAGATHGSPTLTHARHSEHAETRRVGAWLHPAWRSTAGAAGGGSGGQ